MTKRTNAIEDKLKAIEITHSRFVSYNCIPLSSAPNNTEDHLARVISRVLLP